MEDHLNEEMTIANEQDSAGTALTSETFLSPIKELKLPPVAGVESSTKLGDAIKLMQDKKIGSLIVTDNSRLIGIFTERDVLMKVIGVLDNWQEREISEVMTTGPQTLMDGDEIAYVLNNMHVGGYRHVPIVDENEAPVSMVSIKDVVSWILDHFPQEITNLTGEPFRGPKTREGA